MDCVHYQDLPEIDPNMVKPTPSESQPTQQSEKSADHQQSEIEVHLCGQCTLNSTERILHKCSTKEQAGKE